jgi:hypothetical protein
MTRQSAKWFTLCCFAAAVDWYVAVLLSLVVKQIHHRQKVPADFLGMYYPSFFDEFEKKVFVSSLLLLAIITGLVLSCARDDSDHHFHGLVEGTIAAVLLIPLTMVGMFGVAVAPEWPAAAPPVLLRGGTLWCLPGLAILAITAMRHWDHTDDGRRGVLCNVYLAMVAAFRRYAAWPTIRGPKSRRRQDGMQR